MGPKVLPFLGYFFNEPTKSGLIGEKSPNLVTLIGIAAFDFVALCVSPGISIGGAEVLGISGSFSVRQHFLQTSTPTRKITSVIRIMAAGNVKVHIYGAYPSYVTS